MAPSANVSERLSTSDRGWKPTLLAAALVLGACGTADDAGSSAADGGKAGAATGAGGSAADGGSGGTSPAAGGGAGSTAAGSGSVKQSASGLYGAFTLGLVAERPATATADASPARTSFLGIVSDGERPSTIAWVMDMMANGCTLYTPSSPLCEPSCGSSAVCVSDGMCAPHPKPQDVGTITLKGVGSAPIEMTPVASNKNYQPKASSALPFPPCAEGDEISLAVEGGTFESFELKTKCIGPLDFQGPVKLDKGMPLKLSWAVPSDPTLARIQVNLDISHHGGSRGEVRCEVDDNGALELPAAMVDRLLELGVAGFPTISLTRVSSGGAEGGEPANVELIVQQSIEREVQIEGLVSCNEMMPCPSGQTCQRDLSCK